MVLKGPSGCGLRLHGVHHPRGTIWMHDPPPKYWSGVLFHLVYRIHKGKNNHDMWRRWLGIRGIHVFWFDRWRFYNRHACDRLGLFYFILFIFGLMSFYVDVTWQGNTNCLKFMPLTFMWSFEANFELIQSISRSEGPLHIWDWEPVTITLQALSLVEKTEPVQVRFTLRLRD